MPIIYLEAAQRYNDATFQGRAKACVAQQAQAYATSADPAISGMARGILGGNEVDEAAVIRQTVVQDTAGDIDVDDLALLGAVQAAWALVAPARYGGEFPAVAAAEGPVATPQAKKR
jgi:hypothetical protein